MNIPYCIPYYIIEDVFVLAASLGCISWLIWRMRRDRKAPHDCEATK